ncbi:carbohydrate kinase family protein [Aromatoleum petrolei]|uniref:Carbohydrate kinase n=1 Tax=Aromatoleum petrolei TaxID=76116 RepID=A0ABX1MJ74_9RHOO|nr:carbohydrate kinase [Aromatoleum petrolei]NMF87231.1 carbohydrate kinase [Aromatoleum petrolei]QTQ38474.1 Carbohydrate kinase [Aromatoleum petrolei]
MFLVCGEALFDVFIGSETDNALHLDARPGGSPFNVAIGLARLGQPVAFLSGLAKDMLGDRLARVLTREGVDTRPCPRFDAPTTLGMIELDAAGVPHYAFYGNGAADRLLSAAQLPELAPEVAAIHLGSYATVVEPVASALETLVRRERDRRLVAYDPNVRLNVEPSLERWRERADTLAGLAHLVKISDEDVRLLYGETDEAALARRWLAAGARLVVVTRGADGASAWNANGRANVAAPRITTVDTVGAGDTFQSSMLTYLAETGRLNPDALTAMDAHELARLLTFAARAAAITCSRRGADMPRRAELATS